MAAEIPGVQRLSTATACTNENEQRARGTECPVGRPAPPAVDKDVVGIVGVVPDEHLLARQQWSSLCGL